MVVPLWNIRRVNFDRTSTGYALYYVFRLGMPSHWTRLIVHPHKKKVVLGYSNVKYNSLISYSFFLFCFFVLFFVSDPPSTSKALTMGVNRNHPEKSG